MSADNEMLVLDEQLKTCREFISLVHERLGATSPILEQLTVVQNIIEDARRAHELMVWETLTLPRIKSFIEAKLDADELEKQ